MEIDLADATDYKEGETSKRTSIVFNCRFKIQILVISFLKISDNFNWRAFMEQLNSTSKPRLELKHGLLLSQLSTLPLRSLQLLPSPSLLQDKARPFSEQKQPSMHQCQHGNLQRDIQAMVILLQEGWLKLDNNEGTFHEYFDSILCNIKELLFQE